MCADASESLFFYTGYIDYPVITVSDAYWGLVGFITPVVPTAQAPVSSNAALFFIAAKII